MKKKAKQELSTLEESMNVLRREEVEKAIEECQRTLRGEEQSSANERHVSEIQVLRDSIDVEKKKRIRVDDEMIKQQKQLHAVPPSLNPFKYPQFQRTPSFRMLSFNVFQRQLTMVLMILLYCFHRSGPSAFHTNKTV